MCWHRETSSNFEHNIYNFNQGMLFYIPFYLHLMNFKIAIIFYFFIVSAVHFPKYLLSCQTETNNQKVSTTTMDPGDVSQRDSSGFIGIITQWDNPLLVDGLLTKRPGPLHFIVSGRITGKWVNSMEHQANYIVRLQTTIGSIEFTQRSIHKWRYRSRCPQNDDENGRE